MSLMIMQHTIPETFRGPMSKQNVAKLFLTELEERFAKNKKVETSVLLATLVSMRYKGNGNIREYIMEMSHLASKLKALKLELSDELLVHFVLISLPSQFNHFKVSYNCQREKWTLNELISHCVQEEERLKLEKTESAHLAFTNKGKGKKRKNAKEVADSRPQKRQEKVQKPNEELTCFFCKKTSHKKKDCTKYHAWRLKKGLPELSKTQ